ncbi:MAG: EscU/YscU/HrcU family type III secretion system export apparatus switch protein, partial [Pseudomonadota bacterium]|nr:EscU/YscU/HrcU family type III secretion system export apparatus switch protein [Pseudomonadota bacterium]
MAENPEEHEKTEEPSQRKLDDAHEKGDVAKSQEVNSWFLMLGATLAILIFGKQAASSIGAILRTFLDQAHDLPADSEGLRFLFWVLGGSLAAAIGLPLVLMVLSGLAGNLVQHRLLFSTEPLKPKLERVSPFSGFKRLDEAERKRFLDLRLKPLIEEGKETADIAPVVA